MASPLLRSVATAAQGVAESVGVLVDVELQRRTGGRSSVTGNPAFGAWVTVKARIAGADVLAVGGDASVRRSHQMVTLYNTAVEPGDRLRWGGEVHTVRKVRGIVEDAAGRISLARVEVD